MAKRIRRSRARGWRMPEGAVYVGRRSDYGNRYVVGAGICHVDGRHVVVRDRAHAVALYREWFRWQQDHGYPPDLKPLRGKDLCCWCPLDQPCHADVLLEMVAAAALERGDV